MRRHPWLAAALCTLPTLASGTRLTRLSTGAALGSRHLLRDDLVNLLNLVVGEIQLPCVPRIHHRHRGVELDRELVQPIRLLLVKDQSERIVAGSTGTTLSARAAKAPTARTTGTPGASESATLTALTTRAAEAATAAGASKSATLATLAALPTRATESSTAGASKSATSTTLTTLATLTTLTTLTALTARAAEAATAAALTTLSASTSLASWATGAAEATLPTRTTRATGTSKLIHFFNLFSRQIQFFLDALHSDQHQARVSAPHLSRATRATRTSGATLEARTALASLKTLRRGAEPVLGHGKRHHAHQGDSGQHLLRFILLFHLVHLRPRSSFGSALPLFNSA